MTELQAEFGDIVDGAYDHVFDKKVPVGRFVNRLTNLPIYRMAVHKEFLEKIAHGFDKYTTMDQLWLQLTKYWNFLNYFLLEQVVCKFGDADLKTSMEDYASKLKAFRCKTRLCDFAQSWTKINRNLSEDDLRLLAARLDLSWEECTLEDLENQSIFRRQRLLTIIYSDSEDNYSELTSFVQDIPKITEYPLSG